MTKLDDLRARLHQLDRVVVAFSGGADSAFLAYVANETLGRDRVLAVTALSASLAHEERADCEALAQEWGLDWVGAETSELDDEDFVKNDGMRCARCKTALMDVLGPLSQERNATVVLGVNVDDLGDHRPGQNAAAERGAVFPLVDAGYTKADVRADSKVLGLRTWNKPAAACLSSRVPYGTPVTIDNLSSIARAESALRELGFAALRVRHYGDTARIELDLADLPAVLTWRRHIVDGVKAAGYRYVTLDLEGLRSGNLNSALTQ